MTTALPTLKHVHIPGTVVVIDDDQHWSTCTGCGCPIHTMLHDYDGDGPWAWTAWKPAPVPVGDVRPMKGTPRRVIRPGQTSLPLAA